LQLWNHANATTLRNRCNSFNGQGKGKGKGEKWRKEEEQTHKGIPNHKSSMLTG
jgi:hypothetical protein